ncbi:hypothetical protein [Roseobacter sp.]|uniref:hypothetical protein n=1 Tax=Roseobacter sp. TaxID=1907202 RepID=UPI0032999657
MICETSMNAQPSHPHGLIWALQILAVGILLGLVLAQTYEGGRASAVADALNAGPISGEIWHGNVRASR